MKTPKIKLFAFALALSASTGFVNAQELTVTHSAAGALETEIAANLDGAEISSITKLIITGENLNATDATYLRTAFKNNLEELDVSGITFTDNNLTDKLCQQMAALKKVTLPDELAIIGKYAFQTCGNLTEVIWKSVGNIDDYAFANCAKLHITSLPKDITRIGQYGFSKCSEISLSEFPATLTGLGIRVFEFCPKLTIKEISPDITEIKERLFDRTGITEFTISDNVAKISNLGFYVENNPVRTFICRRETAPALGTTPFGAANSISNTTVNVLKKYADAYSAWGNMGLTLAYLTKNIGISISGKGTVTVSGTGLVTENPEITDGASIETYEGEEVIFKVPEKAIVELDNNRITPDTDDNTLYRIPVGSKDMALTIDLSGSSRITDNKDNTQVYVGVVNGIMCIKGQLFTPIHLFGNTGNLLIKTTDNTIDMNSFAHGVYVVKVNNKSFKIVR